jgi:chromosomal replication initiator protein
MKENNGFSPYSMPGIEEFNEDWIIELISSEFKLADRDWVTEESRFTERAMARHILMYCMKTFLNYPLRLVGQFCGNRTHATAIYGVKKVVNTLMTDGFYGRRVNRIINQCWEQKNKYRVKV